jgi:hypothetical protein
MSEEDGVLVRRHGRRITKENLAEQYDTTIGAILQICRFAINIAVRS